VPLLSHTASSAITGDIDMFNCRKFQHQNFHWSSSYICLFYVVVSHYRPYARGEWGVIYVDIFIMHVAVTLVGLNCRQFSSRLWRSLFVLLTWSVQYQMMICMMTMIEARDTVVEVDSGLRSACLYLAGYACYCFIVVQLVVLQKNSAIKVPAYCSRRTIKPRNWQFLRGF